MKRFSNRTVVVTGAGSGIGEATARRLHSEGANVVLCDISVQGINSVAAQLGQDRAVAIVADVSDRQDVGRLMDATADRFGGIDVLVANAGIAFKANVADTTVERWKHIMAVDLDGVFFCVQAALPHLASRRGSIVTTASVSGIGGDARMAAYNAAKGGVVNLTRSLALELGPLGIRVNAVCPTVTTSRMSAPVIGDPDLLAKFASRIPLGRHAEADEIAGPILFLASQDASFVNGVILPVDGGLTASNCQP